MTAQGDRLKLDGMAQVKPRNKSRAVQSCVAAGMIRRNHTGHRVGECHQNAKLTDKQVREIREMYQKTGIGYLKISKIFGCGESTVRDIVTYRTRWAA